MEIPEPAGYLCCAVPPQRDFWVVCGVLQNVPLWLVLIGLNKQCFSPDLECGLLRRVSGLELDKTKLTFLYFSGFGVTQNEQCHIGVTARSIWELLSYPFGLQTIPQSCCSLWSPWFAAVFSERFGWKPPSFAHHMFTSSQWWFSIHEVCESPRGCGIVSYSLTDVWALLQGRTHLLW